MSKHKLPAFQPKEERDARKLRRKARAAVALEDRNAHTAKVDAKVAEMEAAAQGGS